MDTVYQVIGLGFSTFNASSSGGVQVMQVWHGGWYCDRHCYNATAVFPHVDHYVGERQRRWLRQQYPTTPRRQIRRQFWRGIGGWSWCRRVARHPVVLKADLPVERHHRVRVQYADYTVAEPESPVQNESCTPGLGTGVGETTAGDCGIGAPALCSLGQLGEQE